ncbi:MAG: hypothetical protein GF330_01255 [Candidatus Eisenbacteria bacterium]|nr:hypothetical protein [Candidatus Eisenbacteria bacterium]
MGDPVRGSEGEARSLAKALLGLLLLLAGVADASRGARGAPVDGAQGGLVGDTPGESVGDAPRRSPGAEAAALAAPAPADSQRCPICRSLTIIREPIYRPGEPAAETLYGRLANALHVTTREGVVRRGLHFREGQPVCPEDLAASLRRLRSYPFLHSQIEISGYAPGDSVDLIVRTRDVWTTQVDFQIRKEGGLMTWSVGARETNLLGLGKKVSLRLGEDEVQTFWGVGLIDPQLLGRNLWLVAAASGGGERRAERLFLERRFEQAATPWGFTLGADRLEGTFVDHRGGLEGPEWDLDFWELLARAGGRVTGGRRWALRVSPGVYLAHEVYDEPDAGAPGDLPPLHDWDVRAPGVTFHYVVERYRQVSGVDAFEHRSDLNLGTELQLFAGYATPAWGSRGEGAFFLLEAEQGVASFRGGFARFAVLARAEVDDRQLFNTRWESALRYYQHITRRQLLATRLRWDWSRALTPQRILTLGAESGLRGFDAYRFWGERVLLLNLEDRVTLAEDLWGLISFGLVGFVDAGVAWKAGERERERPRVSVGLGLRLLGSRTSGRTVTRVDIGFPVLGGGDETDPILSFGAGQAF